MDKSMETVAKLSVSLYVPTYDPGIQEKPGVI